MTFLDTLKTIQIPLPVVGTISGVGILAGIAIIFLIRRKKTISFKV